MDSGSMRIDGQLNLHVREHCISLDTSGSADSVAFVSHAHSDHISALKNPHKKILASDETVALSNASNSRISSLDGLRLSLLPSGHMLGSSQLRVEWDSQSFTYTGDFKLGESLTAKKAEVKETEKLLIEGTFGNPANKFPARGEVYDSISKFISRNYNAGHIVLLGGYSLGKAQELVAIANKYCSLKPVVSESIDRACRVYARFGVRLDSAVIGSPEADELMRSNFVAVMPMHTVNFDFATRLSRAHRRSVYSAVATGWASSMKFPVDEAFPLSDHADFPQLLEYIETAKPKEILCCHGNEERLSKELRSRGWNARPIAEALQARISGW